jgi:hypothetical protein
LPDNPLKRLLDAGAQLTEMSQAATERMRNEFANATQGSGSDALPTMQDLLDRGRESSEQAVQAIQAEIAKQLARFADRFEAMEDRIEQLGERFGFPVRRRSSTSASKSGAPAAGARSGSSAESGSTSRTAGGAKKAPARAKATTRKVAGTAKRSATAAGATATRGAKTASKAAGKATKAVKKSAKKASGATKKAATR